MEQLGQFITNHWELWLALIAILLLLFANEFISQKNRAKELSASAVVAMINHEDAVVIDLREAEAFRKGHIINSTNTLAQDLTAERLAKYKNKPLILVCAKGLQTPALAAKLRQQGFSQVMILAGGIASWTAANLPLVKGKKA